MVVRFSRYDWTLLAPTPVPPKLRRYDWRYREIVLHFEMSNLAVAGRSCFVS